MTETGPGIQRLGALLDDVDDAARHGVKWVPRIWDRDHLVWQHDPEEVADRLGWLDCPTSFADEVEHLRDFADQVVDDGIEHVLLVGMGGSSLYPEVLATTFGARDGYPRLHVLDSTDPAAVLRAHRDLPWDRTLLVAASKSGTTTETRSHLAYFWDVLTDLAGVEAGRQVAAITDPGSALAELGRERSFRAVFHNPTDIGGRFSALSFFGLVPAALLGLPIDEHLARARVMADEARHEDFRSNGPLRLGAAMAAAARAGRDKLTVLLPPEIASFGLWIEQLVAESTGKGGKGVLPVVGEPVMDPDAYGDDRLFVAVGHHDGVDALADAGHPIVELGFDGAKELGAEVFRWEFATAVAGALLQLNPFDQPDVQAAKTATVRVLEEGVPDEPTQAPDDVLSTVDDGDYVALLAFADPDGDLAGRLDDVAAVLRRRLGVPVTVGIGPRYLHSTGQLHKGGPDEGVFLVAASDDPEDAPIPGEPHGFSTLKHAQAAGDLDALREAGRRVAWVAVDDLLALAG